MSQLEETYDALVAHITTEGYPPSVRELGKMLGLSSPDSARERLLALVDAGWIERGPGPRQIRLVKTSGGSPGGEVGRSPEDQEVAR